MNRETYNFSFGDLIIADKGKNKFLESVNQIIDWNKIERLINKFDKRGASADGQPPYSGLLLFKILLLQTWFDLSDPKVEEAINDRISFMKFLNLSLSSKIPDYSTICRFRNSLIEKELDKKLFNEINNQLTKNGMLIKTGAIVDASIISSKNRPRKVIEIIAEDRKEDESTEETTKIEYSKDPDARWLKKGGKYHFGYKVHAGVNKDGYLLGGVITSANKSDIKELGNILKDIKLEKGLPVMGDKGYKSKENDEILESQNYINLIMHKKTKGKEFSEESKKFNKEISKVRYRVEQTFGLLKEHFGFDRVRYQGVVKVDLEFRLKGMAFNLKKAVYSLL